MTAPGAAAPSLLTVRQAAPGDRDALTAMFGRCSPLTRYRRFHGAVSAFPRRYLTEALSDSPVHHALIASAPAPGSTAPGSTAPGGTAPGGTVPAGTVPDAIVALASCRVVDEGMAEVGILVEDAWQRCGLGSALLGELVAHAQRLGLRALTAQLLTGQAWTAAMLARYGSCRAGLPSRGVVTVTLRLPPGP